jgi:hypothetical protein
LVIHTPLMGVFVGICWVLHDEIQRKNRINMGVIFIIF